MSFDWKHRLKDKLQKEVETELSRLSLKYNSKGMTVKQIHQAITAGAMDVIRKSV